MPPLVSILIPAYNAEQWIADTLSSALDQSWRRKEIIVVDDGSTDSTCAIARSFQSRSVKVIAQENRGASVARNTALREAQGSYIQWLDADDLLATDKISEQMKTAERDESGLILLSSSMGTFYWRREKAIFTPTGLWQDLSPVDWLIKKLEHNIWMIPAVWLVSRKITEKAGPWNEALSLDDDGEYFCRVVAASERIRFLREAKCYYRQSGYSQLSRRNTEKANKSLLTSNLLCIEHLRKLEESERTRRAGLAALQSLQTYYYHDADKPELAEKLAPLARDLGGSLSTPKLAWKWQLLRNLLGWHLTKKIMNRGRQFKLMIKIYWDRLLYSLGQWRKAAGRGIESKIE